MKRTLLLLCVLATASADALPGSLSARTTGPASFTGDADVVARVAAFTLEAARGERGALELDVAQGAYRVIEYRTWVVARDDGHPLGRQRTEAVQPAEVVESGPLRGRLVLLTLGGDAQLRLLPGDGGSWAWRAQGASAWHLVPPTQEGSQPRAGFSPPPGTPDFRVPQAPHATVAPLVADVTGRVVLFAYDALLLWRGPQGDRLLHTGTTEEGLATDPAGWHNASLRTQRVLVVEAAQATFRLASTDVGWRVHLHEATLELAGSLVLAEGRLRGAFGGRVVDRGFFLARMEGSLSASARLRPDHQAWTLEGDVQAMVVDGDEWDPQRLPVKALLLGGLLTLGAWAAWAAYAKSAVGVLAHRRAALDSPTRVEMLRLISRHPGITTSQLARRLGIARQSAALHVRRLRQASAIDSVRRGSKEHHQLDSGSFRFFAPAPPREEAAGPAPADAPRAAVTEVLACLSNPVRRELHRVLREAGRPLDAKEVAAAWRGGSPPGPRLLRWHARRLVEAGVLTATRRGRRTLFAPAVDPGEIFDAQARSFLRMRGLTQALRVVEEAPGLAEAQAAQRVAQAQAVSLRVARERVRDLHAFGFVDVRDGRCWPAPRPRLADDG